MAESPLDTLKGGLEGAKDDVDNLKVVVEGAFKNKIVSEKEVAKVAITAFGNFSKNYKKGVAREAISGIQEIAQRIANSASIEAADKVEVAREAIGKLGDFSGNNHEEVKKAAMEVRVEVYDNLLKTLGSELTNAEKTEKKAKSEAAKLGAGENEKQIAADAEKKVNELKADLEIAQKERAVCKCRRELLSKPANKDKKLDLKIAQKELEVAKENNPSKKSEKKEELKKLTEIRDTISIKNTDDLSKAKKALAEAKRDEIIATKKKEKTTAEKEVKTKEKELAKARKKDNQSQIPQLPKLNSNNSPKVNDLYLIDRDGYLLDEIERQPLTRSVDINGQKKDLNYLQTSDGNFYLVDKDKNLVDEKGAKLSYENDFNYSISDSKELILTKKDPNDPSKNISYKIEDDKATSSNDTVQFSPEQKEQNKKNLAKSQTDPYSVEKTVDGNKLSGFLSNSKNYCTTEINNFKKTFHDLESKVTDINNNLNKTTEPEEKAKLQQQLEEAKTKKNACQAQYNFLEAMSKNFTKIEEMLGGANSISDTKQKEDAQNVCKEQAKEALKRFEEFKDLNARITRDGSNFDYENPSLNSKNIASMNALTNLIKKKTILEERQCLVQDDYKKLFNDKSIDENKRKERQDLLKKQQDGLNKAHNEITSEKRSVVEKIEEFNNVEESNKGDMDNAAKKIKTHAKEVEYKSTVKKDNLKSSRESEKEDKGILDKWSQVKNFEDFLEFIRNKFHDKVEDFVKHFKDNESKYSTNSLTDEVGNVERIVSVAEGRDGFAEATGLKGKYDIKETHWYSSKQNKILAAAQETYNKNVEKIERLKEENKKLSNRMDPFANEGEDTILAAIKKDGIHLPKTRDKAENFIIDMRGDSIKDFLGIHGTESPTPEQEQVFNSLSQEEKMAIFRNYYDIHKNDNKYTNEYTKDVINFASDTLDKRFKESSDKIYINNEAIKAAKEKNIDIVKDTKNIIDKKLKKIEYKEKEEEYRKSKEGGNGLTGVIDSANKLNELKTAKKELKEKKRNLKSIKYYMDNLSKEIEIKNREGTYRKNIEKNDDVKKALKDSVGVFNKQNLIKTAEQKKSNIIKPPKPRNAGTGIPYTH